MVQYPTTKHEQHYWENGYIVIGLDEVGRGAVAGPVVVGAVAFDPKFITTPPQWVKKIRDSKTLSALQRTTLSPLIKKHSTWWSIGMVPADVIDIIGMTKSLTIAAQEALRTTKPTSQILTDRNLLHGHQEIQYQEIIGGDSECLTIAAASIVAKVWRDTYMDHLARGWQQKPYRWQENKGYATARHLEGIKAYGPSFYHRHSFLHRYT